MSPQRTTRRHFYLLVWCTGLPNSVLYTLWGSYDKYTVFTEKIVVDLFSLHRDISFYNNKLEKNDCLYSKNLNWKFWGFLPQNPTYNFEAVWGQYSLKSLLLVQSHSKITIQMHFSPWGHAAMDLVLFNIQGFHTKTFFEVIFLCLTLNFIIKCVLNIRNRAKLCVKQKGDHFEHLM